MIACQGDEQKACQVRPDQPLEAVGSWEAIVGAGPVVPVPATDDDVDAYLVAWDELLQHLAR